MATIDVKEVKGNRDLRRFFNLPRKIYKDDPCYVEPLRMELKKMFNEKKNPFFKHAKIQSYLAYKDGEVVGRITAIHNWLYNDYHKDKTGFFGFFESINDVDVARALFDKTEEWLKNRGLDTSLGPMSFSTNDISPGILIKGFEYPPYIDMSHALPYYRELVEKSGYEKAMDVLAFKMPIHQKIDERVEKLAKRVKEEKRINIRFFDPKHYERDINILRDIYNSAWKDNWGFVPMTDEEFAEAAKNFNKIKIIELAQIAEIDGKPIGFSLTLPNINEALIHMNGRLFPFGIFKFLYWMKRIKGLRMLLLGIRPEFRKRGADVMLFYYNMVEGQKLGYTEGELSWILEINTPIIKATQYVRGEEYKRYRIFQKRLV